MNKLLPFAACCVLIWSCNEKPDIRKVKQSVFGNLIVGDKISEYNKVQDSLLRSGDLHITSASRYPYFQINKRDFIYNNFLLMFPSIYYNADSIITKIAYFIYHVEFPSTEMTTNSTQEQTAAILKLAEENQSLYSELTATFTTTSATDKEYGYNLPNLSQGTRFWTLQKEIATLLNEKYRSPFSTDTTGNEYDNNDFSFADETLWKTDNLNIRFIRKRFPVEAGIPSDDFYFVLVYEFNDDVMKKYKLKTERKRNDLTETF